MKFQSILSIVVITFMIIGCKDSRGTKTPQFSSDFNNTNCMDFDINRTDLECGYLEVPNDYFSPTINFSLPIVIRKAKEEVSKKTPLIFQQGGPSEGGALEGVDWLLENFSYLTDRDLIIYNRRGERYSSSYLSCSDINTSEYQKAVEKLFDENRTYSNFSLEEYNSYIKELYRNKLLNCKNSLEKKGLFPKNFTTRNSSYDLESLRRSLGYKKINLLGNSYGSRLSLEYMELFPENLESVIVDGVLPENSDFLQHSVTQVKESIEGFVEVCKNDRICSSNYPQLKTEFLFLINSLYEKPFFYFITVNNKTIKRFVDGRTISFAFQEMLYNRDNYANIPYMIHKLYGEISVGKYSYLEYLSKLFNKSDDKEDLIFSFIHKQDYPLVLETLLSKKESLGEYENTYAYFNILSNIDQSEIYGTTEKKLFSYNSSVPTLILTGSLDPITPIFYAEDLDKRLKNSTHLVFKNYGHGQFVESCGKLTVENFLNNKNTFTLPDCVYNENMIDFN